VRDNSKDEEKAPTVAISKFQWDHMQKELKDAKAEIERLSALPSVPELPNRPTLRADGICDKDGPIVDALYTEIDRLSSAPTGLTRNMVDDFCYHTTDRMPLRGELIIIPAPWKSVHPQMKFCPDCGAILESSSAPTPETEE
jgi:hypothetical protein